MSVIEDYKIEHKINRSEDIFDISNPPEYQCKKIDELVDKVKSIHKRSSKYDRMEEDELKDALFDINWESDGLEKEVEELRTAIENVRQWGQEWKDFCKKLIEMKKISIDELV
jgi:hypothetical protein